MKSLFVTALCLMSLSAFSAEEVKVENNVESVAAAIMDDQFLGCLSTRRECAHVAKDQGFHHFRSVRDLQVCHDEHHAQIACYGIE